MTNIVPLEIVSDERAGLPSASSFSRTVDCPGWNNLWRVIIEQVYGGKLPESESSPEALRGVRIHRARETMSTLELQDESESLAFEKWCNLERDLVREWLGDDKIKFIEGPREVRLWINDLRTFEPQCSARLDVHYLSDGRVLAVDGKTGAATGSGAAKDNWQLKVTAVALRWEYDVQEATVALVKPEAFPNGFYDHHTCDSAALIEIEREVRHHIAGSQRPDAPRRAGGQCEYCPCKPYCPEAAAYSMLPSVVARTAQTPDLSKKKIGEQVSMLTPADWAFIWRRSASVRNILDASASCLRKLPESELAAFGIRLGSGRTTTTIPGKNTKSACEKLAAFGFPEEQLWQLLSLSKTDVVEAIKERNISLGDEKAEQIFNAMLGEFVESNTGEKILREV